MLLMEQKLVCTEGEHRSFYKLELVQDEQTEFYRVIQKHGRLGRRPAEVLLPKANPDFMFLTPAVALFMKTVRNKTQGGRKRTYRPLGQGEELVEAGKGVELKGGEEG